MWRLTPIEAKQSAVDLRAVARRLHLPGQGLPNFLRLLAKSPATLTAYLHTEEGLAKGLLSPAQREQIALAVAEINGSLYCLAAHEAAGSRAGLSEEEILAARRAAAADPKTTALLHFVQAVVLQRGEINDEDFSHLKHTGFSESEIIEIIANVGLNLFTNYFNILAQTDLDNPPADRKNSLAGNVLEKNI